MKIVIDTDTLKTWPLQETPEPVGKPWSLHAACEDYQPKEIYAYLEERIQTALKGRVTISGAETLRCIKALISRGFDSIRTVHMIEKIIEYYDSQGK